MTGEDTSTLLKRPLIRVDDFPGTKPNEFYRHNLENYKLFEDVLRKHGLTCVLGVIPQHTSDSDLEYLLKSDVSQLAVHGIEHDERFLNEFRPWEDKDVIKQKLKSVRERLGGTTRYIPPHNVIDGKTVDALWETGFREIFVGPETDVEVLKYITQTYPELYYYKSDPPYVYGRSDELLQRKAHEYWSLCMCSGQPFLNWYLGLHWTWEWNIGLDSLDRFLKKMREVFEEHE